MEARIYTAGKIYVNISSVHVWILTFLNSDTRIFYSGLDLKNNNWKKRLIRHSDNRQWNQYRKRVDQQLIRKNRKKKFIINPLPEIFVLVKWICNSFVASALDTFFFFDLTHQDRILDMMKLWTNQCRPYMRACIGTPSGF